MLYDVFISHASEDKDTFVRELAEKLQLNHISVWYDDFTLKVGDSIRRAIDEGLKKSRYGIVVISKNFLNKEWTNWELDGLLQRQNFEKKSLILPIWHNISKKEILDFSPSLADKIAILSNKGTDHVVNELLKIFKPEGSTLLIARDKLISYGYEPPVVTDDWWLDVAEYSGSNEMEGTFQEAMGWGWWGFPLPAKGESAKERGERLSMAATQLLWQEAARRLNINQTTPPEQVLEFIDKQPGLKEACHEHLQYLASYAPQLTIKGFGGEFEEDFEKWYRFSLSENEQKKDENSISGTGLTIDGTQPTCIESHALRNPDFGKYEPAHITCWYVQGEIHGPPVMVFPRIDYLLWFLSEDSKWLPKNIRAFLIEGFKQWGQWTWSQYDYQETDFPNNYATGNFSSGLFKAKNFQNFKLTKRYMVDMKTRFEYGVKVLNLTDTAGQLVKKFLELGFIEQWFNNQARRQRSRSK